MIPRQRMVHRRLRLCSSSTSRQCVRVSHRFVDLRPLVRFFIGGFCRIKTYQAVDGASSLA
jgi:hypothetical protein